MDKKHKKKHTAHNKQKVVNAQHRNEYLYKFRRLVDRLTGDPAIFRMIPDKMYPILAIVRARSVRIVAAPGHDISPKIMEKSKQLIVYLLRNTTAPYTENGPVISLDMFTTVGYSLVIFLMTLRKDLFPKWDTFKKAFPMLDVTPQNLKDTKIMDDLIEHLGFLCRSVTNLITEYPRKIYWADWEFKPDPDMNGKRYYQIVIKSHQPKRKPFTNEGMSRPAFQVCVAQIYTGLYNIEATTKQLEINKNQGSNTVPVYMQAHAIRRLIQRLDYLDTNLFHLWFRSTFINFNVHKGHNGKYFIDYFVASLKVGYFLADIQEGHLLIHTFLFLTHDGTPEGDKLKQLTGLAKLDKAYLNIDKLSTFCKSDIIENPEVKQLFVEAGCGTIFELPQSFLRESHTTEKDHLADKIKAYLTLNNREADEETYLNEQMPEL